LKFAGSVGPKLLIPSLEKHQEWLGRIPEWVAADAGFFNNENESPSSRSDEAGDSEQENSISGPLSPATTAMVPAGAAREQESPAGG
jgi:hypothetical protein